jgi:phosphatidylethanolamine/phosphatidyl-N-methylethanolamine N-methyltransferase
MFNMEDEAIIKAYKRYARNYDLIFGKIFAHGRRLLMNKMNCRSGDSVLEVGIGTGLTLPFYSDEVKVTGIDISPDMLQVAKKHLNGNGSSKRSLFLMDAQQMSFADNTFDKVAAMYVVSVVPQPKTLVAEMKRVCKPGGDIFILNHFSNHSLLPRMVETVMLPFQNLIGFSPRLSMEWLINNMGIPVVGVDPVNLFGYWTLIHAKNVENGKG